MARDLPYVGVSLAHQVDPNSLYYSLLQSESTYLASMPSTNITSLGSAIGNRTYSFQTRIGRQYELGRIEAGEARLEVNNSDGLFDPNNSASSYYPWLKPYRPILINCAYPLTGNILNDTNLVVPPQTSATGSQGSYRVSVGANDSNFELGVASNWSIISGSFSITTTAPRSGTYCMSIPNNNYPVLDVPVVPGKQITISFWYKHSTTSGSAFIEVWDGGYSLPTAATTKTTATFANSTVWTRASYTVTPQCAKISIVISNYLGTTATFLDDIQVEFGATATTNVTTGPTIYPIFNGLVERYPQRFVTPNQGRAEIVATDAMASMARNTLGNVYESKVIQDGALYYYPLSEPSGSTAAYNNSIYQQSPLTPQSIGASTTYTFGDTSAQTGIVGAGTTGVALQYNTSTGGTVLANKTLTDVFWSQGDTYSFAFWYKIDTTYTGVATNLFEAYSGNNISFNGSPTLLVQISNGGAGVTTLGASLYAGDNGALLADVVATPIVVPTGVWNFVRVGIYYDGTTYRLVLGNSSPSGYVFATNTSAVTAYNLSISSVLLKGLAASYNTKFAHFIINRSPSWTVQDYYALGATGLYGDSTGNRFVKMINTYSGMKYIPVDAEYGKSFMPNAVTSGTSLMDYIQSVTDTEFGTWYVDADGYAVFKDRHNRLKKLIPSVTFGDGAGETPYSGDDLIINYDPTYVLNDVTITRSGGTTVAVQDQDSLVYYFPRSYSRTIGNLADSEVTDAAFFLLARYKDPHVRPETITLTPARNPAIWSTVLGLQIGDLVRVKKRPLGASLLQVDCFIERIEHDFDAKSGEWIMRVTVSPTIVYYWNLASLRATTTGAAVAGSFVFTKGATSTAGLANPRDIRPGQMLQYTLSGTTYVDVVSGAPTETATTVTVPATRVGTITSSASTVYYTTLAADIKMDYTGTVALSSSRLSGLGITTFLIDEELVTGSVAGSTLTITGRAVGSTIQTASGSQSTTTYTASHLTGATIYAVTATSGGNVATGTVVSELLPNQTNVLPYTIPSYTAYDTASTLGSWTNSLASATVTKTTPASGIAYSTVTVNKLVDYDNYPTQDLAVGQLFSLYNNTAAETLAAVAYSSPSATNGTWTLTGYKVTDSGQTLSAAVTPDATTITCSGNVTASAILVGLEFMQVTAGSGTSTLTVTRGTPDAAVWKVLSKAPHYQYDKIYTVVNAALANTYAINNAVIEGYQQTTPVTGTARLGY